jgi:signal transduction histidine kinase
VRGLGLRLSLLPACIALGLYAEWAALSRGPLEAAASGAEIRLAAADFVVGLVLVGCGLVAWTSRPETRTGLLLTAAGIAWFLGTFAGSGWTGYADFGALFLTLHRGPIVHALLSYPTGRLERPAEWAAVAFSYVVSAIAEVGETPVATISLAAVVLVVGAQRFARAVGPQRRARAAAAVGSAAFAAILLFSGLARLGGSTASLERGVLWAYQVVVAGIAIGLTLDLVRGGWVTATVTGLVVDLGKGEETGTLRDHLANALGDRSLVLGYWLADRGVYVDDRGRELELPEQDGDRRVTIVREGGEPVAALVHSADVLADRGLVESVAAAARIAVVNARLQTEVRRQVDELEASRSRLVEVGDSERRRLERELHDGAERRLTEVEALLDKAARGANGGVAAVLAETQAKLDRTRSELREFARGIHPRVLTDGGLPAALEELAERAAVPVELYMNDARYPAPVEAAVYFVCSEALANVGKHADALGATVEVTKRDHTLVIVVSDDGRGGARVEEGSGLRGLADRVEALGGRLTVTSRRGAGTRLVAELPVL